MNEMLFKKVDYTVCKLLDDIEVGILGLPDLQRPFVWDTTRVRDLLDSMYRGYPVGTLLFWESGHQRSHRNIGTAAKQKDPALLIVDGQQRLSALFAVMKQVPIIDKDFRQRRLRIAFHPLKEPFEVTNPAIERDVAWIPDVGVLWQADFDTFGFVTEFRERLAARGALDDEEARRIPRSIQRVVALQQYPMTALEITARATEEQVSEIFVRINSKGRSLNQADFILTLMSVYWDEGRRRLEEFARTAKVRPEAGRASPYNAYFQPSPDQLLRVAVAVGFRRARLEHVYSILRGKDLSTGEFSAERRDAQFDVLRDAQERTLDLQHWADFLQVLRRAGYMHPSLITSQTALVYTYALWLLGRRDFDVPVAQLRDLMARWFFMASLTGRYTNSPKTRMDQDLASLRGETTPRAFVEVLEREIGAVLTPDYWGVTLPNELARSSARNPGQFAYYASLCILDAPVLYSKMRVRDLFDPHGGGRKSAIERHHLFPRRYLQRIGVREKRAINQVANYALVEWHDNIDIRDRPPSEYAPHYEGRFDGESLARMYRFHALPQGWYEMDYPAFLEERRQRIADVIRWGYETLSEGRGPE